MVAPNQQIGRYTLLRRLASGGMGEVYLAESSGAANFSKQVAIKCILPHLAQNQDFVQKFIDEANLMVQLHHGSIVPVIELFQEDGLFYLVMEYVPGRDLKSVLRTLKSKKTFMPESVALWVIKLLCEALGYAHEKKGTDGVPLAIIHRDVSPSNVILGASGEVKLLDFGIAKARSRVHQSISGTLQGKFVYMSPEIADGRPVDLSTDLFSVGLVLYELLTHTRPLDGDSETVILRNARECEILPPSIERPELSPQLDKLVMRALAKEPAQRYASAFDFTRAINEYLGLKNYHPSSSDLTEFLKNLFPNGVVDNSEKEIQTIDDALLQQINALTPSFHRAVRETVTQDGTLTLLPNPMPSIEPPAQAEPKPAPVSPTEAPKRSWKTVLVAVIALGAVGWIFVMNDASKPTSSPNSTIGAPTVGQDKSMAVLPDKASSTNIATPGEKPVFGKDRDQEPLGTFDFRITGVEPTRVQLVVDDVPHQPSDALPLNKMYLVCAEAPGFKRTCQRALLKTNRQEITVKMSAKPLLSPVVRGLDGPYLTTVNDVEETTFPMTVQSGAQYRICVTPDNNAVEQRCRRITAKDGHHKPVFQFAIRQKEATPSKPTAMSKRTEDRARPRSSEIKTIPTAEIYLDNRRIGTTPFRVPKRFFGKTFSLRARGYLDTEFRLPTRPNRTYKVNLKRPGYLTMRVTPPASRIIVDGVKVGTGYLVRLPIAPGSRKVEAIFDSSSGRKDRWGPEIVDIVAGKETRLPQIILKSPRSTSE